MATRTRSGWTTIALADTSDIRHAGTKDFGPRLGIAWRPGGKTVVRGGYGFDVFTGMSQETQNTIGWWPDSQNVQLAENSVGQPLAFIGDFRTYRYRRCQAHLPGTSQPGFRTRIRRISIRTNGTWKSSDR